MNRKRTCALLPALAPALLMMSPALGVDVLFVDANQTLGANGGSSWNDAFQGPLGLQSALAVAENGDSIYLARGNYTPALAGDRLTNFLLDKDVSLYGGFIGNESIPEERPPFGFVVSLLTGDLLGDDQFSGVNRSDNSANVIASLGSVRLDGLYIAGGYAYATTGAGFSGGGIVAFGGELIVSNCEIRENDAQVSGGGVTLYDGVASFTDCAFRLNRAGSLGGAIEVNSDADVSFERCTFANNTAQFGGALLLSSDGLTEVDNSLFYQNQSFSTQGGAAIAQTNSGALRLRNVTIADNEAPMGGIRAISTSSANIVVIVNSIVIGNSQSGPPTAVASVLPASAILSSSIIGGLDDPASGISSVDPMFEAAFNGDYTPMAGSPALDAGDNGQTGGALSDLLGRRRLVDHPSAPNAGGAIVDIGAVERSNGALGTTYCNVFPNSTGKSGKIDAYGSTAVVNNNFTLVATDLPAEKFGIFLVSTTEQRVPTSLNFQVCLGGTIGRFIQPGQILNSGPNGTFSLSVDLNAIPMGGIFVGVQPFELLSFQAWHRDSVGFNQSSFTDATTVRFN